MFTKFDCSRLIISYSFKNHNIFRDNSVCSAHIYLLAFLLHRQALFAVRFNVAAPKDYTLNDVDKSNNINDNDVAQRII